MIDIFYCDILNQFREIYLIILYYYFDFLLQSKKLCQIF